MTLDDLRVVLAFPLVSAVVLAVGPYFAPGVRWSRRLRSDLDIASKLPSGPERDEFERSSVEVARKILDYRNRIPRFEKVLSWVFVCVAVFLLALFVAQPAQFFAATPDIPGSPVTTIIFTASFLLTGGIGVYGAFSGGPAAGSPQPSTRLTWRASVLGEIRRTRASPGDSSAGNARRATTLSPNRALQGLTDRFSAP